MAKVYLLRIESGDGDIEVRTFSTKKKAQVVMRKKYNAEKEDYIAMYGKCGVEYYCGEITACVCRSAIDGIYFTITESEIE